MKFLNILRLGFIFAGCFLGAGYVSGQELWQFFGIYGKSGFSGLIFAIFLFFIFGTTVLLLAKRTRITLMDEIVVSTNNKILKSAVGFIQIFFIIGIYIIMCAGAGALLKQLFGIHIIIGSGIFCLAVAIIALKGIKGVMNVFSMFVPPLVFGAIVVGIIAVCKNSFSFPVTETTGKDSFISAIIFVSYNFFASIGILAPVAQKYNSKKELLLGTLCGCFFLCVISVCILMAMNSVDKSVSEQLPMLFIAAQINGITGYIYAVLLIGAMFGTSLSSLVAVSEYTKEKYMFNKKKSDILTILLSILACVLSLIGFDKLIGTIYPLCGVFGFFALIAIIIHYIKVAKN